MMVARLWPDEWPIKINGAGRTERIQDRGSSRHGGAKNYGDQQANYAMGQMLEDKSDEDIIGVLALRIGSGLDENLLRVIANDAGLRLKLADLRGQPLRFFAGSFRHGLQGVAFPGEDIVELRLQRG